MKSIREIQLQNTDPASYASDLAAMTDDEIFRTMKALEGKSEVLAQNKSVELDDILSQIALVEEEIEQRYPGQALAPYKQWQRQYIP